MWKLIGKIAIGLVLLTGVITCNVALKKDVDKTRAMTYPVETTVNLINYDEERRDYTIYLDGYGSENWYRNYVQIDIDSTVTKGQPKAVFTYNHRNGDIKEFNKIILTFHDRHDVNEFMNHGGINVAVSSGRDSNVAIANSRSQSSSCFIDTMWGKEDETYIL